MLNEQLEAVKKGFVEKVDVDIVQTMGAATEALHQSGLVEQAVKAGDIAPEFDLPELGGGRFRLSEALRDGPVVISFYRGAWCPYCNLEMQALQQALPEIEGAGGRLIAIAPELPEHAGQTRDKGNLSFPLLHDWQNAVARSYGLVFTLPESLRSVYGNFGIDLAESQGNANFELPMPATYIVARDSRVAHAFVDANYTRRMEPMDIVKILKAL